jgi:drug/metabolite transporter superfamily protein YnfA
VLRLSAGLSDEWIPLITIREVKQGLRDVGRTGNVPPMMSTSGVRSPYLLRAGLVRNVQTAQHLTTFVVSGVSTVLITRLILGLSGYPQIGGKGLHIAHVLPGGLLMLLAIFLLLAYVGPVVRPAAALIGGVGFGLFIDEVGKFVTSDNNYFYQPTAAIVYVVFVLIVLASRFVTTRRPIDPREQLANVVDHAVEGVAGGLSRRRRAQAWEQLSLVPPDVPGWAETKALLEACPSDEVELIAPVDAAWRAVQRGFDRLSTHPYAPRVAVAVLVVQAISAPLIAAGIRFDNGRLLTDFPVLGVAAGSLLSATFTLRGWLRLRRQDRVRAVRLFELAVLTSLLVTQVFQFAGTQFAAVGGMTLDLALLGVLGAESARLHREVGPAVVTKPQLWGLPPDPDAPRFPQDPADPA